MTTVSAAQLIFMAVIMVALIALWLTLLNASNLRVEDRGVPMHVAALVILDRTPLEGCS